MNEAIPFSGLGLTPKVKHAIDDMGFELATDIQSQAIPLIRTGVDVIGRSQTGTGKTVAFAIPAIERIDTHQDKPTVQVLVLCPTRELAQQACDEIKKLTHYKTGVRPVEVYGGAPMDRQIIALKRANMVIGTPGRVMDHLRRRTLKLDNLRMVVLDEADEMLSMGFKEDIETILLDAPDDRQTVLFSATMPPAILALTKQFQRDPQLIEINRAQVTLDNIEQSFVDAPMGRKLDVLNLLLHDRSPRLAIIFCNTKRMVDEVTEKLGKAGFEVEGLHGDMKQSQRTRVMDSFKLGKTTILAATDVAARGIDVSGVDYVINFDLPQSTEYYVHRIGRTGRAGKSGRAITICSGRRQVAQLRDIARETRSSVTQLPIPTPEQIAQSNAQRNLGLVEAAIAAPARSDAELLVNELCEKGHTPTEIAVALAGLHFEAAALPQLSTLYPTRSSGFSDSTDSGGWRRLTLNIGRSSNVAPNHIVGAMTERTGISGKEIGKIEIFDDRTVVAVPTERLDEIMTAMRGCKICGKPVTATLPVVKPQPHSGGKRDFREGGRYPKRSGRGNDRRYSR